MANKWRYFTVVVHSPEGEVFSGVWRTRTVGVDTPMERVALFHWQHMAKDYCEMMNNVDAAKGVSHG